MRTSRVALRTGSALLAAGHGADNQKRFRAGGDRLGERRIGRIVGQILLAREDPDERSAL